MGHAVAKSSTMKEKKTNPKQMIKNENKRKTERTHHSSRLMPLLLMLHSWLCSNICQSLYTRRTKRNNKHSANTIRHTHFVMEVSTLYNIQIFSSLYVHHIVCSMYILAIMYILLHIVGSSAASSVGNSFVISMQMIVLSASMRHFVHLYLRFAISFQIQFTIEARKCNYFYHHS